MTNKSLSASDRLAPVAAFTRILPVYVRKWWPALLLALVLVAAATTPAAATPEVPDIPDDIVGTAVAGSDVSYPLPGSPRFVALESDSRVWFTQTNPDSIGLLTVTDTGIPGVKEYRIRYFLLESGSDPYDIAYMNGIIWYTLRGTNKIGRLIIASETIETYAVPTADSRPMGIAVAADGTVWFTEEASNKIGRLRLTPTPEFTEFAYPSADPAGFNDLALDSSGRVWATAPKLDRVVFLTPGTGEFLNVSTKPYSRPISVVVDSDNVPWVAVEQDHLIGRYSPGTLALWRWFTIPGVQSLTSLAFRLENTDFELWFTDSVGHRAGRLVVSIFGVVVRLESQQLAGNAPQPMGIARGNDNVVWVAAFGDRYVYEWRDPYILYQYLPVVARP